LRDNANGACLIPYASDGWSGVVIELYVCCHGDGCYRGPWSRSRVQQFLVIARSIYICRRRQGKSHCTKPMIRHRQLCGMCPLISRV
jgi:hypothetical protein